MNGIDLVLATRSNRLTGIERFSQNVVKAWPSTSRPHVFTSKDNTVPFENEVRLKGKALVDWFLLPLACLKLGVKDVLFPGFPPSPLFFLFPQIRLRRVIHDVVPFTQVETLTTKGKILFNWLERLFIKRYGKVYCPTPVVAEELSEVFPGLRAEVCGNAPGADLSGAAKAPPNAAGLGNGFVLAVGTIEPRKNYARLLEAWAERPRKTRLVIVGRPGWGDDTDLVKRRASEDASIVWYDDASDDELRWCYQNCTAFVTLSKAEGFNMPMVEAGLSGKPILASDLPIHRFAGAPWTVFVSPSKPDVLGDIEALSAPNSESTVAYRARFSWENIAGILERAG